ncbi:hypothetical protein D1Y84_10480 [Acidipila sp. EB88]|nr:hypothetical protein D1Y84_10480 [Acidipila sp. EB88]
MKSLPGGTKPSGSTGMRTEGWTLEGAGFSETLAGVFSGAGGWAACTGLPARQRARPANAAQRSRETRRRRADACGARGVNVEHSPDAAGESSEESERDCRDFSPRGSGSAAGCTMLAIVQQGAGR